MSILVNIASEFTGKKAFKEAETATDKLEKRVKALGKSLAITFGAAALANYSRYAVKAFAADEAAAARLSQAVDNLGLSFANARVATFISDLEKTANVADDHLRPAFQALLTTTGSLTRSQELLSLAIDTSRGSGVDLVTTANDIAQSFVGNTRGLRKYNLGLTQAELKTASFAIVQAKLNDQFSGANAAYLDTTAGKLEAIGISAGNAAEAIGGSLVDALMAVSNSTTTGDLTKGIEKITGYITGLIDSVAFAMFSIKSLFNTKYWKSGGGEQIFKDFQQLMSMRELAGARGYSPSNNAVTGYKVDDAAQKAAEAAAAKRAKELAALQKKQLAAQRALTAEQKKQASLKKSQGMFDMEQIQIIAALKGKLSEDEKLRLQLQLAILQGNDKVAADLASKLAESQYKTENLAILLADLPKAINPFADWITNLDEVEARLRRIAMYPAPTGGAKPPATNVPASDYSGFALPTTLPSTSGSAAQFGSSTPWAQAAQNVVVQIDGKAVASALLDQSMSAGQVSYLDRRTGGFG